MAEAFKKETDALGASATIKPSDQNLSIIDMSALSQAIENIFNDREKKKEEEQNKEPMLEEESTQVLLEGKEDLRETEESRKEIPVSISSDLSNEAKAFLESISKAEGTARDRSYQVIVGLGAGKTGAPAYFDDYSVHPNIIGLRTKEGPSTAAGRYQITNQTWKDLQKKYGFTDFSPANQDKAAWLLAKDRYRIASGGKRDLEEDLKNGVTKYAKSYLGGTWAALKTKFNFEAEYGRRVLSYRNQTEVTTPDQTISKSTNMWDY
jgi:muramidase (phage lysozyme)